MMYNGYGIKTRPHVADRVIVPSLLLVLSLLFGCIDIVIVGSWATGQRRSGTSWAVLLRTKLQPFLRQLQLIRRFLTTIFQLAGSIALLTSHRDRIPSTDGAGDEMAWVCLGIAFYFQMRYTMLFLSVPFTHFGVFSVVIERLMSFEVPLFLTMYLLYLTTFGGTLFIVYPRAGNGSLPYAPAFNDARTAFQEMLELAFTVGKFKIDYPLRGIAGAPASLLDDAGVPMVFPEDLSGWRLLGMWLFIVFYALCLVILAILMLRLFMALLSATFNTTRARAQLEWRLQFAAHVLQAELLLPERLGSTYAGKLIDGRYCYVKRARAEATTTHPPLLRDRAPQANGAAPPLPPPPSPYHHHRPLAPASGTAAVATAGNPTQLAPLPPPTHHRLPPLIARPNLPGLATFHALQSRTGITTAPLPVPVARATSGTIAANVPPPLLDEPSFEVEQPNQSVPHSKPNATESAPEPQICNSAASCSAVAVSQGGVRSRRVRWGASESGRVAPDSPRANGADPEGK